MLSQYNSGHELLLLIRRLMREGDVDAVYHALSGSSFQYAAEICLRYKKNLKRFQIGEIDTETLCLDQIRSFEEILNWPDFQTKQENNVVKLDKELLLRLVNSFELDKALSHCEVLGDSSILMQAKYNLFEKMFVLGLIELETRELIRHSTQHQLWELGQSKVTRGNFSLFSLHSIYKWFRHLFR